MDIIFTSVMFLTVVFADPEGDGSFNYLLKSRHNATNQQYFIAHSYPTNMNLKPGDTFYAKVEGICSPILSLDANITYICNADSITIDNKEYESLVRGKQ